jgi:nucleoside-diphosphate-sugar epimerase
MKVLVAGATGTVGVPMVEQLIAQGHQVVALTRNEQAAARQREAGNEAVVADALDRDGLLRAVDGQAADAVIHQLTALRKAPTRYSLLNPTNRLRDVGTTHLLAAADVIGAKRFVVQSFFGGYGYAEHGQLPLTEAAEFGVPTGGPIDPVMAALRSAEDQVRGSTTVHGVALRYGLFYSGGELPEQVRKRAIPVARHGGGVLPMLHHEDAASAAVAALTAGSAGAVYNIADDQPATWTEVFTAMAAALGAPPPRALPNWLLRLAAPLAAVMMCDTVLSLDTSAARRELNWTPRYPTYREGLRSLG